MVFPRIKTDLFFDSPRVITVMDRAEKRALSKAGAFVRRRAQSSLRRRKKSSPPGKPPSRHAGTKQSLKFILFLYEPHNHGVVVGPVKFTGGGDVPNLMEHGGTAVIRTEARSKIARYARRPFMGPALTEVSTELPAIFSGEVRV
jgi:hypothetical protein